MKRLVPVFLLAATPAWAHHEMVAATSAIAVTVAISPILVLAALGMRRQVQNTWAALVARLGSLGLKGRR